MNFTEMVARGRRFHCEYWGPDYIEKLKENCSVQNFHKLFCKITSLYYVNDGNECYDFSEGVNHYNVTFDKKENFATVKRCGPDWNKRDIDATVKTEDVIKLLVAQPKSGG